MFFKKKEKEKQIVYGTIPTTIQEYAITEPWTIASSRLEEGKRDYGHHQSIKLYNSHKVKINNQWQNIPQGINTGFGTANLSFFNYQVVNFIECGFLAQDPLMNNIFDILSTTPFSKGGNIKVEDKDTLFIDELIDKVNSFKVFEMLQQAVKTSFIFGGCFLLKDYGQNDFTQPLNIKSKKLKGFILIEPINCTALNVNTAEVGKSDYMEPEMWYIVGLGGVHKSHLIKFKYNEPPKFLKPLCLYFGMPLTQLIKQDVANTNLISQGIANVVNKIRQKFIKMDLTQFATDNIAQLMARFRLLQEYENNTTYSPIGLDEEISQLEMSLAGIPECLESAYECLSSKTGIPVNKLNGKSTGGLNAGTAQAESDKNFIDKINTIRESLIKPRLIKIIELVAYELSGEDLVVDYEFNTLTNQTADEKSKTITTNIDTALKLQELGYSQLDIDKWLKADKMNGMNELSAPEEPNYDDKFTEIEV